MRSTDFLVPTRRLIRLLLLPSLLAIVPAFAAQPESEPLSPPSPWSDFYEVRALGGYNDNVLLSNENQESSPFAGAGVDLMLFKLPTDGREVFLFGTVDYWRYFSARGVDYEATAISQAKVSQEITDHWELGASLQYVYYDKVFDASTLDRDFATLKVQGHSVSLIPFVRYDFASSYFLELEVEGTRQIFQEFLDDYWETGPKLSLGREYGHRSELAASYEYHRRLYDTRATRTTTGQSVPGTSLEMDRHEAAIELRHYWDKERRWRATSKISVERNEDNGSGYYDYWYYKASQAVRYRRPEWEIGAEARVGRYRYDLQPVSSSDPEERRKMLLVGSLRGERTIWRDLRLFAQFDHESSLSNLFIDEYSNNTVYSGIKWQF